MRGLEGTTPKSRRCRLHYGFEWRDTFREGIDPQSRADIDKFDGRKLCWGRIKWLVQKGSLYPKDIHAMLIWLDQIESSDR